jgi:hypothetical protein
VRPSREPDLRQSPASASLLAQADAMLRGGDPVSAAKAVLAAERSVLADAATRAKCFEIAAALAERAQSANATRAGIDARLASRQLLAAVHGFDGTPPAERDRAFQESRALFDVLVRGNGAPPDLVLRHKLEAGQTLWGLAKGPWKQAGVTCAPGFVLWVNGVTDARRIRAGQMLRVPLEPVTVLVRKSTFELTVLLGGAPVARFPVAVGADAKTPVGTFSARDCLKNPDWYVEGRRIPFGAPGNIIGTRWIGLSGAPEADGIGIHGTNDEASIGKAVSLGCVRMKNADVEQLFDWIGQGTKIEIRD